MYTAITLAAATILSVALVLLMAKRNDATFYNTLKAITVVFCAVGFFRFMLSDSFIFVINGGLLNEVYYDASDPFSAIIRWGYFSCYSVIPMAVFTKSRLFRNIACYYSLPFSVLSAVYFERYMPYFTENTEIGIYLHPTVRSIYFALELILSIFIVLTLCLREKHVIRITDKREIIRFFTALPFVVLLTMPSYVPQATIGYSNIHISSFGAMHYLWIILLLVSTFALYRLFRFRSKEDRYNLCLFLTLVLFFHYNSLYLMGFTLPRLPIQLCNMASFFYLLAIPFKMNRFFQFCFIVNITGTLIAIFSPDFSATGLAFWNLHYIFEHSLVLMVPVLAMGLRLFPRINRTSLKYAGIGFLTYYVFCMVSGTLLNVFSNYTGEEVNYFFMFDLDKAKSFVSFITFVTKLPVTIGAFTFYPLLFIIVFIVFSLLCLAFYYFTLYCYRIEDDHLELRKAGLDLLEQRLGRPTKLPREFQD